MEVSLVRITADPIGLIAAAASECYGKDTPSDPWRLVDMLYTSGHLSVFEHVNLTFYIKDVSRALLAQLTRHRTGKYTVRSQRYCDESTTEVYLPYDEFTPMQQKIYADAIGMAKTAYKTLLNLGVSRELARMVLPNAQCTSLYVTIDLRNFIGMCHERLCLRSQKEIRDCVGKMASLVSKQVPQFGYMFVPKCGSAIAICNKPCGKSKYTELGVSKNAKRVNH